jgi:hypothetical protein
MWGDSLSVHLNWNLNSALFDNHCTATVQWDGVRVSGDSNQITSMMTEVSGSLVKGVDATGFADLKVTEGSEGTVRDGLKRPTVGDIVLEVPINLRRCQYHLNVNLKVQLHL